MPTFGVADQDFPPFEVDVFPAKPETLKKTEAGPIEQRCHQAAGPVHTAEHRGDLRTCEDDRDPSGATSVSWRVQRIKVASQNLRVEKE